MNLARACRIVGAFTAVWAVLYVRFSSGVFPATEVDPFVHWALLPIALLIGAANGAFEVSGSASVPRRDTLWGLSTALASFAIAHWAKLV